MQQFTIHVTLDETTHPNLVAALQHLLDVTNIMPSSQSEVRVVDDSTSLFPPVVTIDIKVIQAFWGSLYSGLPMRQRNERAWEFYSSLFQWSANRNILPLKFVCGTCALLAGNCRCPERGREYGGRWLYNTTPRKLMQGWSLDPQSVICLTAEQIASIHDRNAQRLPPLIEFLKNRQ